MTGHKCRSAFWFNAKRQADALHTCVHSPLCIWYVTVNDIALCCSLYCCHYQCDIMPDVVDRLALQALTLIYGQHNLVAVQTSLLSACMAQRFCQFHTKCYHSQKQSKETSSVKTLLQALQLSEAQASCRILAQLRRCIRAAMVTPASIRPS